MREQLIELLNAALDTAAESGVMVEHIADHLLDNGVIVPSVKVGQTVYYITDICGELIKAAEIHGVYYHGDGWVITLESDNSLFFGIEWGVDRVYATREAAEAALKVGENE